MRRFAIVVGLALLLAACASGGTAPPVPRIQGAPRPTAETWGPESHGLQIRASVPSTAARGDWIEVVVTTRVNPRRLPPGVRTIDARGAWYFARLRLTPVGGGDEAVVRCVDPSAGMPDPPPAPDEPGPRSEDGYPLRSLTPDASVLSGRVEFPLAATWDRVTAGAYDAVVELAVDETAHGHGAQGEWPGGDRSGVLRSAPMRLNVSPAPVVFQELELPSEAVGGDPGGTVLLTVRVRNGFALGLRGESVHVGGGAGPEFADSVREFVQPGSGDWVIFETSYYPEHMWHPGPGSRHYRVLWRGTCPPVER